MAFGQLYYTSCLTGLAGAPGFQYNAVSPGVTAEVMRDAEALTTYRPPRGITLLSDAEAVRSAPRNLCFRPGPPALIANVVYTGVDYSRRPGNFFAHTLVTGDLRADLGGLLPIDLWRAPCWTATPAGTTRLAALPAPPAAGPLDDDALHRFLAGRSGRQRLLPALIAAAADAVHHEQRKLVIVAPDSDDVAGWLGLLSRLLPPATAYRMSFATYQQDVRYSTVHVVGTSSDEVVGSDVSAHHVFDSDEERMSDVPVPRLAVLLGELGIVSARRAWGQAEQLATGAEESLDDWLPVFAAALLAYSPEASAATGFGDEVAPWLAEHAARLDPRPVERIADRVLAALAATAGDDAVTSLGFLARAADQADLPGLLERVESAIVEGFLARVRDAAASPAAPAVPIRTASARRYAETALAASLPGLPAPAALAALRWAGSAGIRLPGEVLFRAGRQIGPALLTAGDDPAVDQVLSTAPRVRAGVVAYLDEVGLAELDRMVTAFGAGLADRLRPELDDSGPAVQQALAVVAVRTGRLDPVAALRSAGAGIDERLLAMLLPTGPWPAGLALRILSVLGDRALVPPVLDELEQTVLAWPATAELTDYADLCLRLSGTRVSRPAELRIGLVADADEWPGRLRGARGAQRAAVRADLREWFGRLNEAERELADALLLIKVGDRSVVARAELIIVRPALRRAYCAGLAESLRKDRGDLAAAATALRTLDQLARLRPSPQVGDASIELDRVLRRTLGRWDARQQQRLVQMLAANGKSEPSGFARHWFQQAPPRLLDRLLRRRPQAPDPSGSRRRSF
ncbi:GTPase-associated protein 1-related protein [Actinoplanes oblitus]|uniref:GTPase-associated protein 1-related protein n=1 Tax=Actinoplanes oblitus TaxID=3040509 RepID=A0ABY8W6G4_9ACTN|nr:GTPase-associated protein 1-related protein [Actinoplanes oblitus]WIM93424.1 GTPase-associated protein 1-related protein [Actinoplanes oblitus]